MPVWNVVRYSGELAPERLGSKYRPENDLLVLLTHPPPQNCHQSSYMPVCFVAATTGEKCWKI
jgi:hypothetical protein